MRSFWITLAALLQISVAPVGTGTLEGIVVDSAGRPIERAEAEALIAPPQGGYLPPRAITDQNGRFRLSVAAGAWRVRVTAPGYARQEYGASVPGFRGVNTGTVLDVLEGQTVRGLRMRLTGNAIVSGRITGSNGDPLVGMEIVALLKTYNEAGEVVLRPDGNSGTTDDRGEYRIAGLTPGHYYVRASAPIQGYGRTTGLVPGSNGVPPPVPPSPGRFASTYYPGSTDVDAASRLDLEAGSELRRIDFALPRPRLYRIRGRVIAPSLGEPLTQPLSFIVQHTTTNIISLPDIVTSHLGAGGTFEIEDIAPGEYWVTAVYPTLPRARGYALAQVSDADVNGIEIELLQRVSISGSLRVEGNPRFTAEAWGSTNVALRADFVPGKTGLAGQTIEIASDGTFTFADLVPMEYRLDVLNLPRDLYVKEARFGVVDAMRVPIQANKTELPPIEIVLVRGAEISGVVTDAQGKPATEQRVIVIPDHVLDHPELYREATTDGSGRFTVSSVVPGDYRVYAWASLEPFRHFDPDFVRTFESFATPIRVGEASAVRGIEVRLIPPE